MKGVPVVREDYRAEQIEIAFNPLSERFEVADAAIRRNPSFIPNISVLWAPEADLFEIAGQYMAGIEANGDVPAEAKKSARAALNRLANLKGFPLTALVLSPQLDEEQVADVFVRVNSQGTKLIQSDFILTLMSVFWDEGRAELEGFCRAARQPAIGKASPFNHFLKPSPDQLLRVAVGLAFRRARLRHVYSILRGKDLESGKFLTETRDEQFPRGATRAHGERDRGCLRAPRCWWPARRVASGSGGGVDR